VNAQGGKHGIALQAAVVLGRHKIVELLLSQGAKIDLRTVDFRGASLLHAAVACEDKRILNSLLEAGAHIYMADTDASNQTPLHIAAVSSYTDVLQILERSLKIAVKNGERDAYTLWHHAINKGDIDGCTPLRRAVENRALTPAKWLIAHGAKVDIEDFNGITPFHRASQLRDFRMMCQLYPYVTKSLVKATDWRSCVSSRAKRNIVLASGGSRMPSA
jgi:ankyrin repeat protein